MILNIQIETADNGFIVRADQDVDTINQETKVFSGEIALYSYISNLLATWFPRKHSNQFNPGCCGQSFPINHLAPIL